jgi:hypothetical protein
MDAQFTGPFSEQFEHLEQRRFIINKKDREQWRPPLLIVQCVPADINIRLL